MKGDESAFPFKVIRGIAGPEVWTCRERAMIVYHPIARPSLQADTQHLRTIVPP